jgi:Flp pilus assembly protein TadG
MKKLINIIKEERGSELISFTILCPLLVLLFAMIISFGQAFYGIQVATNASATGVRGASIQNSSAEAKKVANNIAKSYVDKVGMGVTFESDNLEYTTWNRKNVCKYYVTVNVKTAMPMKFGGIDSNFRITKSCPALIEKE